MSKLITRCTYWFFAFVSVCIFLGKLFFPNVWMLVYVPLIAGFAYMILKYADKCRNRLKAF